MMVVATDDQPLENVADCTGCTIDDFEVENLPEGVSIASLRVPEVSYSEYVTTTTRATGGVGIISQTRRPTAKPTSSTFRPTAMPTFPPESNKFNFHVFRN